MADSAHQAQDDAAPPFRAIAVAGVGLMGGSIALAARARWPDVALRGIDRPEVVRDAIGRGVIDEGGSDLALATGADLVVLCAPVRQNHLMLANLAPLLDEAALVTDIGSTKRETARVAAANARLRFIGGHPLAGAARGGVAAARADLFHDRPWILTPDTSADAGELARLERFIVALGARPVRMDVDEHDRLCAYLSHLPQLTVSALMQTVGDRVGVEGLALAGAGLRDTTRLAASPAPLWKDIAATNAEAISGAIDDLICALERLKADLPVGDELGRVFDSAWRWKQEIDRPGH